jgi:hypothetical protein
MNNEVLQSIADLYIKDDLEDADFYTLEHKYLHIFD